MKTAFALALLALAVSAPSAAAKSKSCTAPAYPVAGGSFTSLKVTKATCAKARKVALAFHKCRTKTGPTGRCVKKIEGGYACQEVRTSTPADISARVTCKKKKKKVTFAYQQTLA